jgi:hypothetical protein
MKSNTQPPDHPNKSDEKKEVKVAYLQIKDKFSNFTIESRKVIWMILKSNVNQTHHAMITGWLNKIKNKTFEDAYFSFGGKFKKAVTGDILVHFTEALDKIDTSIVIPVSEYGLFLEIEKFFSLNILRHIISLRMNLMRKIFLLVK